MNSKKQPTPYLDWQPAISADDVFASAVAFRFLKTDSHNNLYWIEQRASDQGRAVLVQRNTLGEIKDLTPKPYSVKTRVFEYGGYPYTVSDGWVYFANSSDQRLYKQSLSNLAQITAITPAVCDNGSLGKYMDLTVSPDLRWLVFAYETEPKTGEAQNYIGLIDLHQSGIQEAKILAEGASFYKAPAFSPDGTSLAWLEWNHPYMPWDSTRLVLAKFNEANLVSDPVLIAGSDHSSISDFAFLDTGELFYSVDFANKPENSAENFLNVHAFKDGTHRVITHELKDYQVTRPARNRLACLQLDKGQTKLVMIDPTQCSVTVASLPYADFGSPVTDHLGNTFLAVFAVDRPSEIIKVAPDRSIQTIKKSAETELNPKNVSAPIAIEFPTEDGQKSYGYFYPPVNSNYSPVKNEKPPVRVLVHGGPTSKTSPAFMLSKMFWTSQGFAIFDVNYRGSIGFGRQYRDALLSKWGVLEIQDVKDGLKFLQAKGLISDQAVVSGGSAGGYTVQRLLTSYPDLFASGASYFGIGNLITLQNLTHKYESHYLEQLIGGPLKTHQAEYEARSPINHLDKLKAPMIIFQGSEDKVVPPENSREVAAILAKKGIVHEYYEYPDEAHGFCAKETLVDSLTKESRFLKWVLRARK